MIVNNKKMIKKLFHLKPKLLNGESLLPLNKLLISNKEAYLTHVKKYNHRPEIMQVRLKYLDCLWNDVIHLSPVDIRKLIEKRIEIYKDCGLSVDTLIIRLQEVEYYEIPVEILDKTKTVIYWTESRDPKTVDSEFKEIESLIYRWEDKYDQLPNECTVGQENYFKACAADPRLSPYLFTAIPHVLYCGELDLNNLRLVKN
jgi:hypothetical protein